MQQVAGRGTKREEFSGQLWVGGNTQRCWCLVFRLWEGRAGAGQVRGVRCRWCRHQQCRLAAAYPRRAETPHHKLEAERYVFLPVLRIRDVYPGSKFFPFRIWIFSIPDPRHWIPDPESQHWENLRDQCKVVFALFVTETTSTEGLVFFWGGGVLHPQASPPNLFPSWFRKFFRKDDLVLVFQFLQRFRDTLASWLGQENLSKNEVLQNQKLFILRTTEDLRT